MKQLLKIAAEPAAADVRVGLGCDGDTGRREPGRVLPRGIRFGRDTSLQLRNNGAMSGGGLRTQRRLCARSVPAQQQQRLCLSAKAPACEERQASSCESIGLYFPETISVLWLGTANPGARSRSVSSTKSASSTKEERSQSWQIE
jgi:hypothetical protein